MAWEDEFTAKEGVDGKELKTLFWIIGVFTVGMFVLYWFLKGTLTLIDFLFAL